MYFAYFLEEILDGMRLCNVDSLVSGNRTLFYYVKVPTGKEKQAKGR